MTRARLHEPAAALVLAMAALVILGALGAALGSAVLRGIAVTREAGARDELLNAAESGIDLALSMLVRDPSWAGADSVPVPGGRLSAPSQTALTAGGRCMVTVSRPGEEVFEITSRALAEPRPGRRAGVRVEARRTEAGPFKLTAWQQFK